MNTAAPSEEAKKLKRTLEYELCRDLGAGDAAAVLIDRCLKDAKRQAYEKSEKHAKAMMTAAKSDYHAGWNAALEILSNDLGRLRSLLLIVAGGVMSGQTEQAPSKSRQTRPKPTRHLFDWN